MGQAPTAHRLLLGLGFSALLLGSGCVVRPELAPRAGAEPVGAQPGASAEPLLIPAATPGPAAATNPPVSPGAAASAPASSGPAGNPAPAGLPVLPADASLPAAAGLRYPLVPADPASIAVLLAGLEPALRSPSTPEDQLAVLGHQQQVIYRVLAYRQDLAQQVRAQLPARWQGVFDHHIAARREFIAMHPPGRQRPTQLPAWRIIQPEPAEKLLGYYREAAAATGIPWQVLAAVNLVETGMGRIDGISVADARGPMQFLPSTWAEPGVGNGTDIRDPRSAIFGAARYLVRRGGLKDISKALWGYNNSDHYGRAVLHYAALLQEDPAAYFGLYHWQIHFASSAGDLWLPVGYNEPRSIPVAVWLAKQPAGRPPAGSSGY
ncbi:MAG: lytic transglycosylase domain-containing protein [Synechococcaceae cyanobacterium ELA739]